MSDSQPGMMTPQLGKKSACKKFVQWRKFQLHWTSYITNRLVKSKASHVGVNDFNVDGISVCDSFSWVAKREKWPSWVECSDDLNSSLSHCFSCQPCDLTAQRVSNDMKLRESNQLEGMQKIDETSHHTCNLTDTIPCGDVVESVATSSPINGDHLWLEIFFITKFYFTTLVTHVVLPETQIISDDEHVPAPDSTIPAVDQESRWMTWVKLRVLHCLIAPRDNLTSSRVPLCEKRENDVSLSIEKWFNLDFGWVHIHQMHPAIVIGDQSPTIMFFITIDILWNFLDWRCQHSWGGDKFMTNFINLRSNLELTTNQKCQTKKHQLFHLANYLWQVEVTRQAL